MAKTVDIGERDAGSRRSFRRGVLFGAFCLLAFWSLGSAADAPSPSRADTFKCAFIINFLDFIDWRDAPSDPVSVVLVGSDPKLDTLEEILRQHPLLGEKFTLRRAADFNSVQGAQLVYTEGELAEEQLAAMRTLVEQGTVAVADIPEFIEAGGTIQFVFQHNRWKFRINLEQAQDNPHFRISSKLLRLSIP